MSGFTKGPWRVFDESDGPPFGPSIVVMNGDGEWFYNPLDSEDDDDCVFRAFLEYGHLDDAHLIAAAPNLYESLTCLLDELDAFGEIDPYGVYVEAARVALARARGES